MRSEREREGELREKETDSKSVKTVCVRVCDAMMEQKKGLLAGGLPIMSSRM